MNLYTAWEYLLIDVANQFGLDKLLFEERIQWAMDNLNELEALADKSDKKPLYLKAVMAVRKAQKGIPTGHLVGFDASCSGIQVMSALTGCYEGAKSTGLVDPDVRADAYTKTTGVMNELLGGAGLTVPRSDAKQALMTSFYGSTLIPKQIFGEGTAALEAFYQAAQIVAPGAWQLLQDLLASWQAYAPIHCWQLPDGFEAKVKVMVPEEVRIEVDELGGSTFTHNYRINQGTKSGLSNAANVVHSIDAYVLRSIHRRCNYDKDLISWMDHCIKSELDKRAEDPDWQRMNGSVMSKEVYYYTKLYDRHQVADVVILPYLNNGQIHNLDTEHLEKLGSIIESMLSHEPFEVVTVHDEFKCHPNHMNYLRMHYINIFCDIAEGTILDAVLTDLFGREVKYAKMSEDLSVHIAQSNYALT